MRIIIRAERDRQIAIIFVSLRLVFVVARIKCELIECFLHRLFTIALRRVARKEEEKNTHKKSTTCTHFKCVWLKTPQTSDDTRPK